MFCSSKFLGNQHQKKIPTKEEKEAPHDESSAREGIPQSSRHKTTPNDNKDLCTLLCWFQQQSS
jgi:hypothetical protein